jgi:pimeloyl-ACP methyl ester carboxylesterase
VVHGGFGVTSMFGDLLDDLAEDRRVVAIELQGHGHTRDIDRPFSWESFGDEVAGVIQELRVGQADLLGYSLGGGSSLRCAIQHPDLVRKLVLVSTPCKMDGWFPEVLQGMSQVGSAGFEIMKQSPMYAAYAAVAPDPDAFPELMDKTGALLKTPYDWTEEVKGLKLPTLLIYASVDAIPPSHAAEFYGLLGGGLRDAGWDGSGLTDMQLAIVPGLTHYDIFQAPQLVPLVDAFLG